MRPRLIFVEGLPNSGKSTLLDYICTFLESHDVKAHGFYEDKGNNPIEYYSNAYFDASSYATLTAGYRADSRLLTDRAIACCEGYVVPNWCAIEGISQEAKTALRLQNFFNLPLDISIRVMDELIGRFLSSIEADDVTYVIECALIQNPLRLILLKHNKSAAILEQRVQEICRLCSKYEIAVFMNCHNDPADILANRTSRGPGWTASCIDEFTNNDFGRQRKYSGIEGTISAYRELNDVQLSILSRITYPTYLVDNTGYERGARDRQVSAILDDWYS